MTAATLRLVSLHKQLLLIALTFALSTTWVVSGISLQPAIEPGASGHVAGSVQQFEPPPHRHLAAPEVAVGTGASLQAATAAAAPAASVTAGTKYSVVVLGASGTQPVVFRDVATGGLAETSSQTNLSSLPANWSSG